MGVFNKKTNVYGAMTGMIVGILFTAGYIIYFKFIRITSYNVCYTKLLRTTC